MPFAAPEADLQTQGTTAYGDPIIGATPIGNVRRAQDLGDAIIAGMQNSATGLALRGKLPDVQMGEDAPWYQRLAANVAGIGTDLPLMAVGGAVGEAAGGAVGTLAGPGGAVLGAGIGQAAGAFAAPMALRDALIEAYSNNHALSWSGAAEIAFAGFKGGVKGAVIGGVTGGAGTLVKGAMTGAGKLATGTAVVGSELAALTATSAALEGKMPTWQDFMDNAILLGGLKAAGGIANNLRNVYAETGKTPAEVLGDAAKDPALKAELVGETPPVPEGYVRLYRGQESEHPPLNEIGYEPEKGRWFALDKEATKFYGRTRYVDVPEAVAKAAADEQVEFARITGQKPFIESARLLPAEWANKAKWLDEPSVPEAYRGVALEQRINAAIDADPRPEMIRKSLSGENPPKLGEPPIADPVKYEYITDNDTAKGVLRAVTGLYQTEISAQTRGEVSNKATAVEALKLVSDGAIDPHIVGDAGNAAEIYARAHLLRGATNQAFLEMQKLAATPEADLSPAAKLQALAALERVSMLKAELEGVGAEAGRALQIFRAVKRDPSYLGDADALLNLAERKGRLQDIAKMVSGLKDPSQLARFARDYVQATTLEKVNEAWKAAILTGPQTHLANILGNMMKWVVEVPESAVSASLFALDKAAKGDPLTLAQWKARALSPLYGLQFGAKESIYAAAEVWRGRGEHVEKGDLYRPAIEGKVGDVIRTPFKVLQVEDVLFRTVAERAEAYKMAIDRVVEEGLHPETAEGREKIVQYTDRPEFGLSEKDGLAAIAQVQRAGAESVFSQRLGPRMEMAQRAMSGSILSFVVPFVRTPANLVSWAIQHTPGLNLLSGRWREDFAAGGERRAKATARVVIGTGLTMTAYGLAQSGVLTGGGMFDKEERGAKTAAGWQPYSVKIGDKYYSYQRIEPVAKVMGIVADLMELSQNTKDDTDKAKIASMIVLMFGNATVSTTYLSGLSNMMQSLTDPERYGSNFLEQYATSVVPKIVGQAAAMKDPYKREVDGVVDAIQSQIPFLREKLLPKRDVWGEPQANDRWFEVMPIATSEASHDVVKNEAVRLRVAIADAPKFLTERGPFNPKEERNKLSGEQRDIFKEVSGKSAMTILGPIVNAPDWGQIPDFAKAEIYKHVIEATRKQGQYAALPPDDAARTALRQKIVDKIIKQTQDAEATAIPAPERRVK